MGARADLMGFQGGRWYEWCRRHVWGSRALAARALPAAGRLEVYVAAHCLGCTEALRLAAAAAQRFPELDVHTIDIDAAAPTEPAIAKRVLPDGVVAVPAYLLDGTVIALGNPDPEQLFARIASPSTARLARPASKR